LGFGENALDVTYGDPVADLVAGCRDLNEFGDVAGDISSRSALLRALRRTARMY
jgi:hypothetical protein